MDVMFATVVLVRDDTNEQQTFRVPLKDDTTVLRLAKDALHRYQTLQQQHSNTPSTNRSIGVTKVYVENHEAELFIHDIVKHVVKVKEEKIFLALRQKLPTGASSAAPAPPATATTSTKVSEPATTPLVAPPTVPAVLPGSPAKAKHSVSVATSPPSAFKHASSSQRMPAQVAVASPPNVQQPRQSPATVPRVLEARENSPARARRRIESKEGGGTPEAARVEDVERMSPTSRKAFLNQKQKDGWGAEAHKHFPTNYTSDPEKLARELRKQNRVAKTTGASKDHPMDCDSSQTAVPMVVKKKEVVLQEEAPAAARALFSELPAPKARDEPRPSGWGPMATKYFDPSTYMDDPSKARLSLFDSNDGPIRARRSA